MAELSERGRLALNLWRAEVVERERAGKSCGQGYRSCVGGGGRETDCLHLEAKISWWCGSRDAIAWRGTAIPGAHNCPFWEPRFVRVVPFASPPTAFAADSLPGGLTPEIRPVRRFKRLAFVLERFVVPLACFLVSGACFVSSVRLVRDGSPGLAVGAGYVAVVAALVCVAVARAGAGR